MSLRAPKSMLRYRLCVSSAHTLTHMFVSLNAFNSSECKTHKPHLFKMSTPLYYVNCGVDIVFSKYKGASGMVKNILTMCIDVYPSVRLQMQGQHYLAIFDNAQ